MDLMEFAKSLGFPGLIVLVWFLLEQQKGRRAEKVEERKLAIEERKAEALTVGFTSLAGKIDAHQLADMQSHKEMSSSIARLEGKLDTIHEFTPVNQPIPRKTPAQGIPSGDYMYTRPKTQGGGR